MVQGLVVSLRANGFIAYVPAFDAKGPVYLSDMDGQVQVKRALSFPGYGSYYDGSGEPFRNSCGHVATWKRKP